MSFKNKFISFLQSPWFLAGVLLVIFHIVTGYKYGWDDQHLEIPLLKSLIDPTLYAGDYYVEALKKSFFSYFFVILAKLITVEQIPAVYFFLFFLSRYFLFFFVLKLWHFLTNDKFIAFCCVLSFIYFIRVNEFLYSTFSHQEFALALIMGGIYFFFRGRFARASLGFGVGTNIHALYNIFPMFFMGIYWLTDIRKVGIRKFLQYVFIYLLFSLPFIIWVLQNRFLAEDTTNYSDWVSLYITSCPQNFFYPQAPTISSEALLSSVKVFYGLNQPYIFLILLFVLNIFFNKDFSRNKKAVVFCLSAFFLLAISFVFTYVYLNRFVLDLNLIRNTQYLLFLLVGFTTVLAFRKVEEGGVAFALLFMLLFIMLKFGGDFATSGILMMITLLTLREATKIPNKFFRLGLMGIGYALMALSAYWAYIVFTTSILRPVVVNGISTTVIFLILTAVVCGKFLTDLKYRKLFVAVPLIVFFGLHAHVQDERNKRIKYEEQGFWAYQSAWEDMQRYVKQNTPKDSIILVPYNMEMGGFRIHSERKIVCSYRDCGIIGFDYDAALEWKNRIADIQPFTIRMDQQVLPAIKNAITKYDAGYIVFVTHSIPKQNTKFLRRVYINRGFVLYEVVR